LVGKPAIQPAERGPNPGQAATLSCRVLVAASGIHIDGPGRCGKQAGEFDLPSTPIKGKKGPTKRVLRWREAFGRDQTEIDAMIALKEDELRTMIVDAIQPFFDETLRSRVQDARDEYEERAREQIDQQVGWRLDALRSSAESVFSPYNTTLAAFEQRLDNLAREITLPPAEVPQAQLPEPPPVYVDSRWTWKQQTDASRGRRSISTTTKTKPRSSQHFFEGFHYAR
jgi:hypothetical protein